MSRFRLIKHLLASAGGGGGFTPPAGALKTGTNFNAIGWGDWLWQNRWQAGAFQAVAADNSSVVLPTANFDSNYWAKSVPSGYVYVNHPVTHTPATNPSGAYLIAYDGNLPAGHPVNNASVTISSIDTTAKTFVATPVSPSSSIPMFIQYGINSSDTTAGTYPGGPNATGPSMPAGTKGFYARPQGEAVSTFDTAVAAQVTAIINGGCIRVMKMTAAETNGGTGAPWGGGSQSSPVYKVTMANRATLTSGVWGATDTATNNNPSSPPGGLPIEAAVQAANLLNCDLWYNECWNSDPAVISYNAAYLRDNLSPSLKAYIEIANECWNAGYSATGQAANEAGYNSDGSPNSSMAALRTSGTAIPATIGYAYGVNATRYAEKLVEFFGYYTTAFAAASSQPGGAKPTLKRVAAWWHTQGAGIATALLDYTPPNATTPLKNHVDVYATSLYPHPANVDPTCGGGHYDVTRGTGPLITNTYYDTENVVQLVSNIRAVCDARSIEYGHYEFSNDTLRLDTDASTAMAVSTSLNRDPAIGTWLGWALGRIEAANPGAHINYYTFDGSINSRDGTYCLLEYMLQDPAGSPLAPKYTAYKNFAAGNRYLIDLDGQLIAKTGAQVGDIVGYVRRRTVGSTVTVNSPFTIVDSTATVLAIAVSSVSSFVSAGTATCTLSETGGNPSTTHTTNLTCQITASTFWSAKRSSKYASIQGTSGLFAMDVDSSAQDVCAIASLARANGYVEYTAYAGTQTAKVGFVGPSFTSNTNMYWSDSSLCWTGDSGNVVRNGSVLASFGTWSANDVVDLFISASGKLYGRKNNGSWLPASSNPNTDTGGVDISAFLTFCGGTVTPAMHSQNAGSGVTARFASASYIHTPPTGAHDWNS